MPNKEGGYGGYQPRSAQGRQIHRPGSGNVRRMSRPGDAAPDASNPPLPNSRRVPAGRSGPSRPRRPAPRGETPRVSRTAPARSARPQEEQDGWIRPPVRRPARPQTTPQDALAAIARRARRDRRLRRRLRLLGTALCILLMAGVITAILPGDGAGEADGLTDPTAGMTASLVAPLPYANVSQSVNGLTTSLDWGNVGPVWQDPPYALTAATAESAGLPAMGRVSLSWFDDAAFLGDSLTVGFAEFDIDVGDALICGYEGATPNQIANRATMSNDVRGDEVPLDLLAASQPKKLYILLGANALAYQTDNDEGFLNYYGRMLDELIAQLPDTMIFVQSVLPIRADAQTSMPGLVPQRVASINQALQQLAAQKGCYYLALNQAFADESGNLIADYAQPDGLHLSGSGYTAWVDYLCTHVPYDKDNPYQVGSSFYLTDEMKQLLSDLP